MFNQIPTFYRNRTQLLSNFPKVPKKSKPMDNCVQTQLIGNTKNNFLQTLTKSLERQQWQQRVLSGNNENGNVGSALKESIYIPRNHKDPIIDPKNITASKRTKRQHLTARFDTRISNQALTLPSFFYTSSNGKIGLQKTVF